MMRSKNCGIQGWWTAVVSSNVDGENGIRRLNPESTCRCSPALAMEYEGHIHSEMFTSRGLQVTMYRSHSASRNSCRYALLLHGWLGSGRDMGQLGIGLADAGYVVLVPDLPLHAGSISVVPESVDEALMLLCGVVTDAVFACAGDVLVVGYSMGGRLAVGVFERLQQMQSINVASVVLISSAMPGVGEGHAERESALAARLGRLKSAAEFRSWCIQVWYAAPMWGALTASNAFPQVLENRVKAFSEHQVEAWALAVTRFGKSRMPRCEKQMAVPVFYVHGALDVKYAQMATGVRDIFENVVVWGADNAGHNVLAEQPQTVLRKVLAFLAGECPECSNAHTHFEIASMKVLPYSIPLRSPMMVGGVKVSVRTGILLTIQSASGEMGVGDICPLPGLHSVDTAHCRVELDGLGRGLARRPLILCPDGFTLEQLDRALESLSPVTRSAVEAAIIQALGACIGERPCAYLRRIHRCQAPVPLKEGDVKCDIRTVRVNGVLPRGAASTAETHDAVRILTDSPFRTLKVKVGATPSIALDAARVKLAVDRARVSGRMLRLDANRAWTTSEWFRFQDLVGADWDRIEFIEEPVSSCAELSRLLTQSSQLRNSALIALDESVVDGSATNLTNMIASPMCKAVVLKPSVIGAMASIFDLTFMAKEHHSIAIISSVFESGVGLAWSTLIAAVCGRPDTSHGLGTFSLLDGDAFFPTFRTTCVSECGAEIDVESCEEFLCKSADRVRDSGEEIWHCK